MPSGARVGWKVSVLSFGGWPATVPASAMLQLVWIFLNQFESLDILDAFKIFRSESTRLFQDVPGPRFTRSSKGREHSVNFLQLKVVRINWGDLRLTDFWYFLLQDVARSLSFILIDRVCGMLIAQHGVKEFTGIWQHGNTFWILLEFLFHAIW